MTDGDVDAGACAAAAAVAAARKAPWPKPTRKWACWSSADRIRQLRAAGARGAGVVVVVFVVVGAGVMAKVFGAAREVRIDCSIGGCRWFPLYTRYNGARCR